MSLICDETGKNIPFTENLMAGTREDVNFYSALSEEVLNRIPGIKKRHHPRRKGEGGVDIHAASSDGNPPTGSHSLSGFRLGKFVFSISQETAQEYLPKHVKRYPAVPSSTPV